MNTAEIMTWVDGRWHMGNQPILGAADHATWLGSLVFDGARAYDGTAPDLDRHCARTNESARRMGLSPHLSDGELTEIALEGIAAFPLGTDLYIRPMIWARGGGHLMIVPDPDTTATAMCLEARPMAREPRGIALTRTRYRRPTIDCMPTDVKAGCLYPNNARMLREARGRGFDNAVVLDALGNIAETASSNLFLVRDGEVFTPVPTGCFLAGITRHRVIELLRADGVAVHEVSLAPTALDDAEEIFTTGNANKIVPVTRFEERALPQGPVSARAHRLYRDFAHSRAAAAA